MNTVQTDLTIVGAHTPSPAIYWKGQQIAPVSALRVIDGKVSLVIPEDPALAEMQAAGIKIVRALP